MQKLQLALTSPCDLQKKSKTSKKMFHRNNKSQQKNTNMDN